eukprot:912784_1
MLLYSVIARSIDGAILVEATTAGVEGNHPQVTNQLVQKLISNPSLIATGNRKTFANSVDMNGNGNGGSNGNGNGGGGKNNNSGDLDGIGGGDIEMKGFWNGWGAEEIYDDSESMEYFFHVQRGESVYFICISDDTDGRQHRINYSFLINVQKEFALKYTPNKIIQVNAYGLEKKFKQTLNNMMHHCNTNRSSLGHGTKASQLNAEVESIRNIMEVNIDIIMKNEKNLTAMIDTTDDLLDESMVFKKRGKKLKKVMKRRTLMYKIILVGFGLLTIYLLIVQICGFDLTCKEDHGYY